MREEGSGGTQGGTGGTHVRAELCVHGETVRAVQDSFGINILNMKMRHG